MGNVFGYLTDDTNVKQIENNDEKNTFTPTRHAKPTISNMDSTQNPQNPQKPQKQQRVRKWFEKYWSFFNEKSGSDRYKISRLSWMKTIVQKDIPIGWCKDCGYHLDMHHLVWCPECGLKEPLEIKDRYITK